MTCDPLSHIRIQVHVNAALTGRMLIYLRAFAQRDRDLASNSIEFQRRPWSERYPATNLKEDAHFTPFDTMTKSVGQIHVQVRTEMTISDQRPLSSVSDST